MFWKMYLLKQAKTFILGKTVFATNEENQNQIQCGGVKSQNHKNCVTVQVFMDLIVHKEDLQWWFFCGCKALHNLGFEKCYIHL